MIGPGPLRGEVWLVNLEPVRGHEQGRTRPCIVVSTDTFNTGPAELIVVLPITGTDRGIPLHVRVSPPEGGLDRPSVVQCDQVKTISRERLLQRYGVVSPSTMDQVADRLRVLLDL